MTASDPVPADHSPFCRVRTLLELHKPVDLHPHHAGLAYAVLSEAYGLAEGVPSVLPDGLIPLAPEQARTRIIPGEQLALGFTVVALDAAVATRIAHTMITGLRLLGRERRPRRGAPPLRNNFSIAEALDLVAGRPLSIHVDLAAFPQLEPIPGAHLDEEIRQAGAQRNLTLRFHSPLRTHRLKGDQSPGRSLFDGTYFDPGLFLSRLASRLAGLGVSAPVLLPQEYADLASVRENRFVWLDVSYGGEGKSMDGAVGRVVIEIRDPRAVPLLVLGQYTHVGAATRWGLGGYRIEELGDDPFACRRSASLAEWAFGSVATDRASAELELPTGRLRAAARAALGADSAPDPPRLVEIPKPNGERRKLAIPSPIDLALQRVLLTHLAPALDRFFESSALAYRKGLGRRTAAQRVEAAFAEGFTFAVRADFHAFFDSVDHALLKERLDAYLNDDATVALLMKWVANGSPQPARGLPTGAAVSTLLSNLFLDVFDEAVAEQGGRLIRYADDFLILTRTADEAAALYETTRQEAEQLSLRLNDEKSGLVDLREPFVFLGMRFERRDRWVTDGPLPPKRIEELGWSDLRPPSRSADPVDLRLPGETDAEPISDDAVLIVGPAPGRLIVERDDLLFVPADGRPPARTPIRRVQQLLCMGDVELAAPTAHRLLADNVPVTIADHNGRYTGMLDAAGSWVSADVLRAQLSAADDAARRLAFARFAIASKIHNYAALARALEPGDSKDVYAELAGAAARALGADSVESLLGIEGAAAAQWWDLFGRRLGQGFEFERRVAPNAHDPVNVLLNIAYSALHRQMIIACRVAGLEPSLGILHRPRGDHAALASDLQEPFRHLADRAVIRATRVLSPKDFSRRSSGPLPLRVSVPAARRFAWIIQEQLACYCVAFGGSAPRSYRMHIMTQARSIRRALLDPGEPFEFFRHPGRSETAP